MLNASYATYVSALVNGIANSGSNAGGSARFDFQYLGPTVNLDPNAGSLVSTPRCAAHPVRLVQRQRRHQPPERRLRAARRQPPRLGRPSLAEHRRVRRRRDQAPRRRARWCALDAVYRKFEDFYSTRVDTTTGTGHQRSRPDLRHQHRREHQRRGAAVQGAQPARRRGVRPAACRCTPSTRCRAPTGNIDGETSAGGPNTALPDNYPEYREERWNYPVGDLSIDQRHKARILATYSMPVTSAGDLTIGLVQSFNSGTPYGALGNITIRPYVPANLGYRGAPASVPYFFTARDAFRADASSSTDIAATLNYRVFGHRPGVLQGGCPQPVRPVGDRQSLLHQHGRADQRRPPPPDMPRSTRSRRRRWKG